MRKSRKTIDKCVATLSSKYKVIVTEKEIESGMFSWNVNGSSMRILLFYYYRMNSILNFFSNSSLLFVMQVQSPKTMT